MSNYCITRCMKVLAQGRDTMHERKVYVCAPTAMGTDYLVQWKASSTSVINRINRANHQPRDLKGDIQPTQERAVCGIRPNASRALLLLLLLGTSTCAGLDLWSYDSWSRSRGKALHAELTRVLSILLPCNTPNSQSNSNSHSHSHSHRFSATGETRR